MKIPEKIRKDLVDKAVKVARFSWYNGWKKEEGYVAVDMPCSTYSRPFKFYIKWERAKAPTKINIQTHVENYVDQLILGNENDSVLKNFRSYLRENYFVNTTIFRTEVLNDVDECLSLLISVIEKSDDIIDPKLLMLHNTLKNYQCAKEEFESVEFLHASKAEKMHNISQT